MHPHLHAAVVAQVELGVAVHAAGIAGVEAEHFQRHRLFVQLRDLALTGVGDACHAWGKHIVHRLAVGIFLDVDNADIQLPLGGSVAAAVEIEVVGAPFAAHKLQGCEAQVRGLLEAGHEYAGEAYGGEVADGAHDFFEIAKRNLELIPFGLGVGAVAGRHHRHLLVGDVVLAYHQVFGTDGNPVLEITLVFVECVVLVDVLHVGSRAAALVQWVGGVFRRQRVAFHAVVAFVAFEDAQPLFVVVVAAVEVVVVAGRVVQRRELVFFHSGHGFGRQALPQAGNIVGIRWKSELVVVGQSVQADVLGHACAGGVVERVGERVLLRHAAPYGLFQE